MCLAVPVRVESVQGMTACCRVGEGETFIDASLMLVDEEICIGDYLIVHAGFALRKLDLKEAQESLRILREMLRLTQQGSGGTGQT
jgi:hydrogenase expression/formation protein HypC